MSVVMEETSVVCKTKELCETILNLPEYQEMKKKLDAFEADDTAKSQYRALSDLRQDLHHKQHHGEELTDKEMAQFEEKRVALLDNSIARGFIEAREKMHELQDTVTQYVSKTLELGRVPAEEDFAKEEGSCGSGCGCH